MGKFEIKQAKNGSPMFNLKAGNGEIIAVSEVYTTESACLNGVESIRKNAPEAPVEDQTVEGFETLKHPKFELYLDTAGEYRFRLKAKNGQIIAVSEGYTTMSACDNGIASVKKNAPDAEIVTE